MENEREEGEDEDDDDNDDNWRVMATKVQKESLSIKFKAYEIRLGVVTVGNIIKSWHAWLLKCLY